MRFAKCETCTVTNEGLDRLRLHGGAEWKTSEANVLQRLLDDHNKVGCACWRFCAMLLPADLRFAFICLLINFASPELLIIMFFAAAFAKQSHK